MALIGERHLSYGVVGADATALRESVTGANPSESIEDIISSLFRLREQREAARHARVLHEYFLRLRASSHIAPLILNGASLYSAESVAYEIAKSWRVTDSSMARDLTIMRSRHLATGVADSSSVDSISPRESLSFAWQILTDEDPGWRVRLSQHGAEFPITFLMEFFYSDIVTNFGTLCNLEKYIRDGK